MAESEANPASSPATTAPAALPPPAEGKTPPPPTIEADEVIPPGGRPKPKAARRKPEGTPLLDAAIDQAEEIGGIGGQILKGALKGARTEVRKVKREGKEVAHAVVDEAHKVIDAL